MLQAVNGGPTLFCSDFNAFGSDLNGFVNVVSNDDDFIGFAFGVNADYLLLDWKRATQQAGAIGLAVSRVTGIPSAGELFSHTGPVDELARGNTLGNQGYSLSTNIGFRLVYTSTRLQVWVDGDLEIDLTGSFPDGQFCFYTLSQGGATFSGFTRQAIPCDPGPLPFSDCQAINQCGGGIGGDRVLACYLAEGVPTYGCVTSSEYNNFLANSGVCGCCDPIDKSFPFDNPTFCEVNSADSSTVGTACCGAPP